MVDLSVSAIEGLAFECVKRSCWSSAPNEHTIRSSRSGRGVGPAASFSSCLRSREQQVPIEPAVLSSCHEVDASGRQVSSGSGLFAFLQLPFAGGAS